MRRCETGFLQAGYCRHPEAMTMAGAGLGQARFPALVGVIRHPVEGLVLFDTGYDPAFLEATRPFPERLYRWLTPPVLGEEESAAAQLRRMGHAPEDVRWVVLSHFHGDHIAGMHAFPNARIACARAGLDAMRSKGRLGALASGVLPALIPADIAARAVFFEDRPRVTLPSALLPFEEGADLFGDGALLAVELPGHCPGHWGLVVRGEDDALHFLTADASWSSRAIRENRPPPALTTAFLGRTAPYRETLERLHRLALRAPEVVLTPAHCRERAAEIIQSP